MNVCRVCGRVLLAGQLCTSAALHPCEQPHNHTPAPSESIAVLGKVAVVSASTQHASAVLASAWTYTGLGGTVRITWPSP